MGRGKFIVFEGIDGCGKSTQARLLRDRINEHLRSSGSDRKCELQEEPYIGDITGGNIRSVLSGQTKMPEDSLAYLFVANRLTHISVMAPKLMEGNHIICDRYYFSNFAYNQTENITLEDLISLNRPCMRQLKPDAVFYLHVSPETAAKRRGKSRLSEDINDSMEKQTQVDRNFDRIIELFSDPDYEFAHRIYSIDSSELTKDMTADIIWEKVREDILGG
ncbi:MAG: dTMP kinase [Oscillospiraceae bacterium]|nr:dTMP kinase [Oscillospiraceae bacterium]